MTFLERCHLAPGDIIRFKYGKESDACVVTRIVDGIARVRYLDGKLAELDERCMTRDECLVFFD